MADVYTKTKRSWVMSRIRRAGNKKTELALVRLFRAHGITGWRRQLRMFGNPDFAFQKLKLVVFVDGCFWHGCPSHGTKPENNAVFWHEKLASNKKRDRFVTRKLRREGWRVLRIWEHDLKTKNERGLAEKLIKKMRIQLI